MTPATHVTVTMSVPMVGHATFRRDSATAAMVLSVVDVMPVQAGLPKSQHKAARSSMMHVHGHFTVPSGGNVHHLVLWHVRIVLGVPVA